MIEERSLVNLFEDFPTPSFFFYGEEDFRKALDAEGRVF
jgi:hypothetical protein